MLSSKPISTHLVVGTSLTANDGTAPVNATMYRQVIGDLQLLRMTRPDISFVVNKLSRFMHTVFEHHLGAVKHLLRYLNDTRSLGIRILVDTPQTLHGFSYADWAGNPNDHTSTSAFLISIVPNPISWSSIRQRIIDRSSTEVEYHAIVAAAVELQWVKPLLSEPLIPMQSPPTLFSDNLSATYLFDNPVFHFRMKHLVIDYHFVRDLIQSFKLRVAHVSTGDQLTDALTKSLSRLHLLFLYNKIDIVFDTPS